MNGDNDGPELAPGVREVEHTADVGIEVHAGSVEELFRRAAAGMMAVIRDAEVGGERGRARSLTLELERDDLEGLLVRWLRELLHLQESEGFVYGDATFRRLDAERLEADVTAAAGAPAPVRELKGVTYHGLRVRQEADGRWRARVIFDL